MPEGGLAEALLQTALEKLREPGSRSDGVAAAEFAAQLLRARQAVEDAALKLLPQVVTDPAELAKA